MAPGTLAACHTNRMTLESVGKEGERRCSLICSHKLSTLLEQPTGDLLEALRLPSAKHRAENRLEQDGSENGEDPQNDNLHHHACQEKHGLLSSRRRTVLKLKIEETSPPYESVHAQSLTRGSQQPPMLKLEIQTEQPWLLYRLAIVCAGRRTYNTPNT